MFKLVRKGCVVVLVVVVFAMPVNVPVAANVQPFAAVRAVGAPLIGVVLYQKSALVVPAVPTIDSIEVILML